MVDWVHPPNFFFIKLTLMELLKGIKVVEVAVGY